MTILFVAYLVGAGCLTAAAYHLGRTHGYNAACDDCISVIRSKSPKARPPC